VTTRARCAGDRNPDATTSFGHGGGALIPCETASCAPHPFRIEKGIVFITFHRERTIGRPSPNNLVVADAACAAISSQMLPAGPNSRARKICRRKRASLAANKLPTPDLASLATSKARTRQTRWPCDQQIQHTRARPECSIHADHEGQQDRGTGHAPRFGDVAHVSTPACIAARSFLLEGRSSFLAFVVNRTTSTPCRNTERQYCTWQILPTLAGSNGGISERCQFRINRRVSVPVHVSMHFLFISKEDFVFHSVASRIIRQPGSDHAVVDATHR
jgi:hypothetical protein